MNDENTIPGVNCDCYQMCEGCALDTMRGLYEFACVCNVGVQECPAHPDRLKTKEEKIEFRKQWDRRVER